MASNYIQPGNTITLVAPYQRNTGLGALVGSIFGVALQTVANAVAGEFATVGVWLLEKTSAQAWTQGAKIYWDNTNYRCDSDPTVGMLIGVATVAADNPSSTGYVRLNGVSPSTAEGAQGAVVALTDSTGLSGTHDDTLAATAALVTLTDSTGDSATHNDTVADGLTVTAPAAITDYAAVVNMTNPVTKTEGEAVSAALAVLENEVTALTATVASCVTDLTTQNQNDSDIAQKVIEIVTQLAVTNQNISDVAQKVLEIRTALVAFGAITA